MENPVDDLTLSSEIEAPISDTISDDDSQTSDSVTFEDLGLNEFALKAVEKKGFVTPSPIQVLAIPRLLNGDTNLIARARTGTGKTAAFGLPIIQNINEKSDYPQALVLEPTRELAMQTCEEMKSFTSSEFPRTTVLYGGASYATQIRELKKGSEIIVGTPGRIKDHLERKTLDLSKIKYFILDEGDEMLDMGFIDDIREIFEKSNAEARILLFSATMPKPILKIAGDFMGEYEIIEEEKVIDEALLIDQKYWMLKEGDKIEALVRLIDMSPDFYGLVFTMTKMDADRVTRELDMRGYEAAALHGDIMQNQREKVLERFRMKKTRILVATDVAARGIDISGLSHVVNYSLPFDTATYVHRIGRTGRAGTEGIAITFVRPEERRKLGYFVKNVSKATKSELKEDKIPTIHDVLEIKEKRVIKELEEKLFVMPKIEEPAPEFEENDDDFVKVEAAETTAENATTEASAQTKADECDATVTDETSETSSADEITRKLKEFEPKYIELARSLCENQKPENVLAAVLSVFYGEKLSPKHYGRINTKEMTALADGKRIFVSLGKRDGYRAKEIADYFSELLHIPGRMVDDIDVAQQFSLLTLPAASARKAIEMSKTNRKLPHMHYDDKEEGRGSRKGGNRERGEGRRNDGPRLAEGERSERKPRERRPFDENREERGNREERRGGERPSGKRDRSRFIVEKDEKKSPRNEARAEGRSKGSRPNVHTQTQRSSSRKTNNASAFIKKSGNAERF